MVSQGPASELASTGPAPPWAEAGSTLVVLSPHLDDAVLSCGALIADASRCGVEVVVLTVFNGRPIPPISGAARGLHARCGLADDQAVDEREREDDRALGLVGAKTKRLGLLEALYRNRGDGTPSYHAVAEIFEAGVESEQEALVVVDKAIGDAIATIRPDVVLAPLGVGGHIDHLLVSTAARRLPCAVLNYEDVPYVLSRHRQVGAAEPGLHWCTPHGWSAKISAIECYASQLPVLWPEPRSWQDELMAYARFVGDGQPAERLWIPSTRSKGLLNYAASVGDCATGLQGWLVTSSVSGHAD